jgi:DNA-binding NarL/FixJ family response regulator
MLTVSRDDADPFDALRAGASGYLLKDIDPARHPHALEPERRRCPAASSPGSSRSSAAARSRSGSFPPRRTPPG